MTKEEIFEYDLDVLYTSLNWSVSRFTDDFQVFLAVVALITIIPIAWIYSEDRDHSFLKIVLFINMSTFIMMFSGLRQAIAISIGVIAYRCVKKKKLLLFIVFVIIAMYIYYKLSIKAYNANVEVEFLSSVVKISEQIDQNGLDANVPKVVSQVLANDIKKDKIIKRRRKKDKE